MKYILYPRKTLSIDNWFGSEDSESPHRSCGCVISELVLRHPLFPGRGEFDMLQKAPEPGEPGGARRSPGSPAPVEKKHGENGGKWWISGISLNKLGLHGQKWWNIDENSGLFCGFCSTKKVFHEQNHGFWIGVRQKQTHIFAAKLLPGKNNTGISLNSSHSHGLVPWLHPEKVVVGVGEHIPLTSKLFTLFSSAASEITGRKVDSVWSFCSFLDVFLVNVV